MTQTTQEPRNRYVDLLRFTAVCFVCVGHWLVTDISYRGGRLHGVDALALVHWAHWLTLVFQVMPLIFLAGGYANAVSWSAHRRPGAWGGWLAERARGLLVPTSVYVATGTVTVAVCLLVNVDVGVLAELGWATALHLWFLPLYLALLALTPALYALYRRLGLWLVTATVVLAALVNVLVLGPRLPLVGWLNYLLVWGGMYLLGFAWREGALRGARAWLMAAGGAVAWVLLITVGPFPVSLIGVPGARIANASPPTLALYAHAVTVIGLLVAAEGPVNRWLRDPRRWRRVSAGNRAAMGLYLWHMAPAMVAGAVLYPLGLFPEVPTGTGYWWLLRVAWVGLLWALLVPLVMAVGTLPRPPARAARTRWRTGPWLVLAAGVGTSCLALARIAVAGFAPSGRLPWPTLLGFAAGVLLVLLACGRRQPATGTATATTGQYT